MSSILDAVLSWSCLATLAALAAVARLRARERRRLGEPIHVVRGGRAPRWALGIAALAVLGLASRWPSPASLLGSLAAGAALGLALWSPGTRDRVCGSRGVRAGWEVLGFEEFAEWRLTGDHLRFRGGGEWAAVDLPRDRQATVRARLEELRPEAESRFRS